MLKNVAKIIGAIVLVAGLTAVFFCARNNGRENAIQFDLGAERGPIVEIAFAADFPLQSSVNVASSCICGNGIIEWCETCDDGANNGQYGYCGSTCLGPGPHCGDGIIQSAHEQCDDGALNGTPGDPCNLTCSWVGGGGGGGGGATTGAVVLRGYAYPGATVILLQDGGSMTTVIAGSNGYFEVSLSGISPGNYNFALAGEDLSGRHSTSQTYPVTVIAGSTNYITDILLPPTASTDKAEVKEGNIITVSGQAVPGGVVTILIHSVTSSFFTSFTTTANTLGDWTYAFNTIGTPAGDYYFQMREAYSGITSPSSTKLNFTIGAEDVVLECWLRADLNCDGYVDLIDYSIAAYWWKRPLTPAAITKVDDRLYPDGIINLRDFSVMAYYWTGSPSRNVATER